MYPKYSWIQLDLVRNSRDFRPESYRPLRGIDEDIQVIEKLGTDNEWAVRRKFVLNEVYYSMEELVAIAKSEERKSLATLKPAEIIDFVIEEGERDWKEKWLAQNQQGNVFELDSGKQMRGRPLVRKLPYK